MKRFLLLLMSSLLLTGCFDSLWTGATLVYDRHNVSKKVNDYQLQFNINHLLARGKFFPPEDGSIEIAVFNGDVLLAGYVPSEAIRNEVNTRVVSVGGYRRLFNQLSVRTTPGNSLKDSWITGEIRSHMIAEADLDPSTFKVVTADQIVYLMGDVNPEQASRVITMARQCDGVKRVVKLFKYYNLSDSPRHPKR